MQQEHAPPERRNLSSDASRQSLQDLLDTLDQLGSVSEVLTQQFQSLQDEARCYVTSPTTESQLSSVRALLTTLLARACKVDDAFASDLLRALADLTRGSVLWRAWLGPSGWEILSEGYSHDHECVLQYVIKVLRGIYPKLSAGQNLSKDTTLSCLRLIANCCADNNTNRHLILTHDGLAPMLALASRHVELDVLIPALYNVCSGYEDAGGEHATTEVGLDTADPSAKQLELEAHQRVTKASLTALCLAQSCPPASRCTTFELLLSLTANCSADRRGFLAELVQIATQPALFDLQSLFASQTLFQQWNWTFEIANAQHDTLKAAKRLADEDIECRTYILNTITNILSQEESQKALLLREDRPIWPLVDLTNHDADITEPDDEEEDLATALNQFLKMFYVLTARPEFTDDATAGRRTGKEAIDQLMSLKPAVEIKRTCIFIVLSQLSSSDVLREEFLDNNALLATLPSTFRAEQSQDILYPVIALASRLARSPRTDMPLATSDILGSMRNLFVTKGLGLTIPYETVNTYRLIFKNRPTCLQIFMGGPRNSSGNIMSDLLALFHRSIESGTKLEVGQFFIEVLRTMFPLMKDVDRTHGTVQDSVSEMFLSFLDLFAPQIATVLNFVCVKAEPEQQRAHGWFGLGMLSVWSRGRAAIIGILDDDEFRQCLIATSTVEKGPAPQNLKLMLGKMQSVDKNAVSDPVNVCLEEARRTLGLG